MRPTPKSIRFLSVLALAAAFVAVPVMAQNPTGTLTGSVRDADGAALPGVTITATSPKLQGERITVSGANGGYKFPGLPAGDYRVTYQLEGFATAINEARVSAAQTVTADIGLQLETFGEEIVVTTGSEAISETNTVASTYSAEEIDELPISRDINQTVQLAPGVHATGPNSNITINGAMSFENLWLVNGVVINENVRGQSLPLFIEDAIQETTTSTAGISAEYGRFTGGVVNVLTKSGGNDFSGSLRVSFTNDDWQSDTPLTTFKEDTVNDTWEGTLGGRILTDRLWFFAAIRDFETATTGQTVLTNISYPRTNEQTRTEGKLTFAATPRHSLIGSYLDIDQVATNAGFLDNLDLASLTDRGDPQEITSFNYTGIMTESFFVEAQYSEREYPLGVGSGGPRDLYTGSPLETTIDSSTWHAPFFCGGCEQELRNNDNTLLKASYFLTTDNSGSHDIAFGYDTFTDIRFSVNHQSGSDFRLASSDFFIGPDNAVYPIAHGNLGTDDAWVSVWPVFGLENVNATDFVTNSFFVNDSWQLNDKWSFNLGVRYDENDGRDAGNALVVDDSKISPRLGFSYDVKGDGDLVVNGSYGTYVAAIANNQADNTATGGAIGRAILFYGGEPINPDGAACLASNSCTSSADAVRLMVDWWLGVTGFNPITDDPNLIGQIPGVLFLTIPGTESNTIIPDTVKSPGADEFTIGVTKRLGSRGLLRADLILREWEDFYAGEAIPNRQVSIGGNPQDLIFEGNFDRGLERDYIGLNLQGRYRVNDRFTVAGTYTWSELEGNINGETAGSGPTSSAVNEYREYKEARWNSPVGPLLADQTHKLRAWAIYNIVDGDRHNLSASLLQNYFSGSPYSASGNIPSAPYVTNPGYISPPGTTTYFFSARGAFESDDITSTDLSLNYSFDFGRFEMFLSPQILNVFNEDSVTDPDNTIRPTLAPFNPFTETPVEGTHWEKRDTFGQAIDDGDFQTPRTFRFSVGFRF